jgi:DNA-binding LytR/AlgR family response regulator
MEVVLCDDKKDELDVLKEAVSEWCVRKHINVDLHAFSGADWALDYYDKGANTIDLAILDILMPRMSGIDLAGKLRKQGCTAPIVFLTSSNDFAAESYAVGAFSYLLKPLKKEALFALMDKVTTRPVEKEPDESFILLQTKQQAQNLRLADIVYAEVRGHTLTVHMSDGSTVEALEPMREFAPKLLSDERFQQTHASFLVNMEYVEKIRDNIASLRTGGAVPISRSYRNFKSRYIEWAVEQEKRH